MGNWQGHRRGSGTGGFDQNIGVPGVVYILTNDGFKDGYYKIGCSRRSGRARAFQLNTDANTGTPGSFRCIFEQRTLDCGLAEQVIFDHLREYRAGKWGQEFFEVDFDLARRTIRSVCADVDLAHVKPPRIAQSREASDSNAPTSVPVGTSLEPPLQDESARRRYWLLGAVILVPFALLIADGVLRLSPVGQTASTAKPAPVSPILPVSRVTTAPAERQLSRDEAESIEAVCQDAKQVRGPAAYRACVQEHRKSLIGSVPVSLDALDRKQFALIQAACWNAKNKVGPKAYGDCLRENLRVLNVSRTDAH